METVLEYITLYAPIVVAIVSEIGVVMALISKITAFFKQTNDAVKSLKEDPEYKALKGQMDIVIRENYELKKKLNIVLEQITRVKVEEDEQNN